MSEDTRNVIDQIQSRAMDYTGKELSPQEMGREFMKWDIETRVKTLQELSADTDALSVGEAAKRYPYEDALRRTHEILRKVGR